MSDEKKHTESKEEKKARLLATAFSLIAKSKFPGEASPAIQEVLEFLDSEHTKAAEKLKAKEDGES